jgi:HemY protein
MRVALWLVGLFAAAVALALFAVGNQGTVTFFWPPYRVDLSLNLALLLLLAAFVLLYLLLRGIAAALELPRRARRWRALQRERAAHALLLEGMTQLSAGRYLRARKAAEGSLARAAVLGTTNDAPAHAAWLPPLAHLLAAEGAHALQDQATRNTHLAAALQASAQAGLPAELREGIALRAARWSLHDRDPQAALARLAELPIGAARRTAALRVKLMAAQTAGHHAEALETARLLAKHRAFSPAAAASLIRGLASDLMASAHDPQQLQETWQALGADERAMPELALRAAQRLIVLGGDGKQARLWLRPPLTALLERPEAFEAEQRARLIRVLERSFDGAPEQAVDPEWLARVEAAQLAHPGDATLQYLAGMSCQRCGLWGKAKALFTQAARGLDDLVAANGATDPETAALRRSAWRALAILAEREEDAAAATVAWRQAGRE